MPICLKWQWPSNCNGKRFLTQRNKRKKQPNYLRTHQNHMIQWMIGTQMPICQRWQWCNNYNGKKLLTRRNKRQKLKPLQLLPVVVKKRKQAVLMMVGIQMLTCLRCQWLSRCNGRRLQTRRKLKPRQQLLVEHQPVVVMMVGIQMLTCRRWQWLSKCNGKRLLTKRKPTKKQPNYLQTHQNQKILWRIGIQMPICQRWIWSSKSNGTWSKWRKSNWKKMLLKKLQMRKLHLKNLKWRIYKNRKKMNKKLPLKERRVSKVKNHHLMLLQY